MSKPIDQELLPCPFCGGNDTEDRTDDGIAWTHCKSCGATGPTLTKYSGEEGEPCTDWNTRASVQPAGGAVPDGHVLVPIAPTDEMIVSFAEKWYSVRQAYDDPEMDEAYRAMIAAAPHPVSGEQKAETIESLRTQVKQAEREYKDVSTRLGELRIRLATCITSDLGVPKP